MTRLAEDACTWCNAGCSSDLYQSTMSSRPELEFGVIQNEARSSQSCRTAGSKSVRLTALLKAGVSLPQRASLPGNKLVTFLASSLHAQPPQFQPEVCICWQGIRLGLKLMMHMHKDGAVADVHFALHLLVPSGSEPANELLKSARLCRACSPFTHSEGMLPARRLGLGLMCCSVKCCVYKHCCWVRWYKRSKLLCMHNKCLYQQLLSDHTFDVIVGQQQRLQHIEICPGCWQCPLRIH